jgi:hypothetical protein
MIPLLGYTRTGSILTCYNWFGDLQDDTARTLISRTMVARNDS